MQNDPRAWLFEIEQAAAGIARSTADVDYRAFAADENVRHPVAYRFIVIGGMLERMLDECPDIAERFPSPHELVNLRHRLIHERRTVTPEQVWACAETHSRKLHDTAAALLDELGRIAA